MPMQATIDVRRRIQQDLRDFSRGEIDFQALVDRVEGACSTESGAPDIALELVEIEENEATGALQRGFFMQSRIGTEDGDPRTSDGIFVFMGAFPDLIGGYVPAVGDEVILSARVSEFFSLTQLSSARLEQLVTSMLAVDTATAVVEADPPTALAEANRFWERAEGMRIRVPAGSRARSRWPLHSQVGVSRTSVASRRCACWNAAGVGISSGSSAVVTLRRFRLRRGRSACRWRCYGIAEAGPLQVEQATEAAQAGVGTRPRR